MSVSAVPTRLPESRPAGYAVGDRDALRDGLQRGPRNERCFETSSVWRTSQARPNASADAAHHSHAIAEPMWIAPPAPARLTTLVLTPRASLCDSDVKTFASALTHRAFTIVNVASICPIFCIAASAMQDINVLEMICAGAIRRPNNALPVRVHIAGLSCTFGVHDVNNTFVSRANNGRIDVARDAAQAALITATEPSAAELACMAIQRNARATQVAI